MIDSIKGNITPPLSVKKIWYDLKISKDDYYRVLSISKDEDLELHFKSQSNSCFVNIYFDVGFKAWQAWQWHTRVKVFSEKKTSGTTRDSLNIFKKLNIDCNMETHSATVCNENYNFLNHLCWIFSILNTWK